jgi:hypothetical protein
MLTVQKTKPLPCTKYLTQVTVSDALAKGADERLDGSLLAVLGRSLYGSSRPKGDVYLSKRYDY